MQLHDINASSQRGPIEEEAPLNEPRPTRKIVDDLDRLVAVLPLNVQTALSGQESLDNLLEVVLDLGRPPEARYPNSVIMLSDEEVGQADIQWVVDRVGAFGDDNRAGIERTLHRISVIRNRGRTGGADVSRRPRRLRHDQDHRGPRAGRPERAAHGASWRG